MSSSGFNVHNTHKVNGALWVYNWITSVSGPSRTLSTPMGQLKHSMTNLQYLGSNRWWICGCKAHSLFPWYWHFPDGPLMLWKRKKMGRNVRKRTFMHVRTAKIQIRLRILIRIFIRRIFGSPRMQSFFTLTTNTLIRLCGCEGWFESSLSAYIRRYVLSHSD